jgi:hypothetical protein
MARRRARTRYVPIRTRARRVSRGAFGLGNIKSIAGKVLLGFGALSAGTMIASRVGVDPRLVGGALGYFAGGIIPALVAVGVPMLMQRMQPASTTPEGQVWV